MDTKFDVTFCWLAHESRPQNNPAPLGTNQVVHWFTAQACLKTQAHLNQFVAPFQILALRQRASVSALRCVKRLFLPSTSLSSSTAFFLTANCKQTVKTAMRSDYKLLVIS